jgi:hypothetical protein
LAPLTSAGPSSSRLPLLSAATMHSPAQCQSSDGGGVGFLGPLLPPTPHFFLPACLSFNLLPRRHSPWLPSPMVPPLCVGVSRHRHYCTTPRNRQFVPVIHPAAQRGKISQQHMAARQNQPTALSAMLGPVTLSYDQKDRKKEKWNPG